MTNKTLEIYDEIRSVGKDLNGKLFDELNSTDFKIAARALGVLKKDALVLESESEMDMFADFAINDYVDIDGYNAVRRFSEKSEDLNDMERSILNALLSSSGSLFEIVESDRANSTLWLRDLLNPGKDVQLTEIGLSLSPKITQYLIYTRVVAVEGLNITSGAPKLFGKDVKDLLLSKYKKKMSKVRIGNEQTKLAAAFYQLYRIHGNHGVEFA